MIQTGTADIVSNFPGVENSDRAPSHGEAAIVLLNRFEQVCTLYDLSLPLFDTRGNHSVGLINGHNTGMVLPEVKSEPQLQTIPVIVLTKSSLTKPLDVFQFFKLRRIVELFWLITKLPQSC